MKWRHGSGQVGLCESLPRPGFGTAAEPTCQHFGPRSLVAPPEFAERSGDPEPLVALGVSETRGKGKQKHTGIMMESWSNRL